MSRVKVSVRKSKKHGKGLFADEHIPKGTVVIHYAGQKISKKEGARRARFYDSIGYCPLFNFNEKYDIDALVGGNDSIYINHSKRPNMAAYACRSKISFETLRDVRPDEELLFDYGFTPERPKKFT